MWSSRAMASAPLTSSTASKTSCGHRSRAPAGVRVVPFYDRSGLISRAVDTLKHALLEETIIVTLVHIVFLLHLRSVLIVTMPLPLAVLAAFLGMRYLGISANIMSLAGIAIAIGVLVDAAIVVTENAFRFLEQRRVDPRDRQAVMTTVRDAHAPGRTADLFLHGDYPAGLSAGLCSHRPGGQAVPSPAFTKTCAVLGATLLAVTLVPVLCSLLLGGRMHGEGAHPVLRPLTWVYRPLLRWALRHRVLTLSAAALVFAGRSRSYQHRPGIHASPQRGRPDVYAGHRSGHCADAGYRDYPEAERRSAAIPRGRLRGRENRACRDLHGPLPLNMTETVVHLKPASAWRPGMTREKLLSELDAAVTMPGVANIWTQPIINRINMLTTGIRSEVGVKLFGHDLTQLEERARAVATVLQRIPGAVDVYPEQVTGAPYLDIRVDREAAARYGITVGVIQDVIETAVGETNLTLTIEGRQRFPVRVRYARPLVRRPKP